MDSGRYEKVDGLLRNEWTISAGIGGRLRPELVDDYRRIMQQAQMLIRFGIPPSKYHDWVQRYEAENRHNGSIPKGLWLQKAEREAIIDYYAKHPDEGYRRLAYMMLDENIAAVSLSSVYRALKTAGKLRKWARKPSKKGTGFKQPSKPKIRKVIKTKSSFPTPQAARKLLYLATMDITRKWSAPIRNWPLILNQPAIRFEDRWPV